MSVPFKIGLHCHLLSLSLSLVCLGIEISNACLQKKFRTDFSIFTDSNKNFRFWNYFFFRTLKILILIFSNFFKRNCNIYEILILIYEIGIENSDFFFKNYITLVILIVLCILYFRSKFRQFQYEIFSILELHFFIPIFEISTSRFFQIFIYF